MKFGMTATSIPGVWMHFEMGERGVYLSLKPCTWRMFYERDELGMTMELGPLMLDTYKTYDYRSEQ